MQHSPYLAQPLRREADVIPPRHTPWGVVQTSTRLADGIWKVSTASHGGIWLSPARRAQVPAFLVPETFLKSATWFEEDCDQRWPRVIFGRELGLAQRQKAIDSLRRYKPQVLARLLEERP